MINDRKARLLAEIKQFSSEIQAVQPDDITLEDIMQEYKVGKRWAQELLVKLALAQPDKFKRVLVRKPGSSHPMFVLRPTDRCIGLPE
jgi:hypothetical protein